MHGQKIMKPKEDRRIDSNKEDDLYYQQHFCNIIYETTEVVKPTIDFIDKIN
jgi:hypothetical protein